MPAMIIPRGTFSRVLQCENTGKQTREPGLCGRELVQLAMGECFASDQPLEYALDRMERRP